MEGVFFWVLMLLWLVLGIRGASANRDYFAIGGSLILFLLMVIVGLKVFGSPL